MSNPALDRQIKIALRDDQKAEKFAEYIAELAAQIVNATLKFAEDVKSTYESIPKRRLGDKNLRKSIKPSSPWEPSTSLCMFSIDILFP